MGRNVTLPEGKVYKCVPQSENNIHKLHCKSICFVSVCVRVNTPAADQLRWPDLQTELYPMVNKCKHSRVHDKQTWSAYFIKHLFENTKLPIFNAQNTHFNI